MGNPVSEKRKKSMQLKIDLSEDEYNMSAQKEKLYIKVNKDQNIRKPKQLNEIGKKFSLFCQRKGINTKKDQHELNCEPKTLELSLFSNVANQNQVDTPINWLGLDNSIIKPEGVYNTEDLRCSNLTSEGENPTEKHAPLTCPKIKPSQNYFSVDKPTLYSPQNLSTLIFNPHKKTNSRMAMTLNFLRDRLGDDRFDKIKDFYDSKGSDRSFVFNMLKPTEKEFMKIIEYTFNEQSPSTQDSGSVNLDIAGLRYK